MTELWESPFFGVTLTILAYWLGCRIQKRPGSSSATAWCWRWV